MMLLKKYKFFFITLGVLAILTIVNQAIGVKAAKITVNSLKEMFLVIPPVFLLLGLLDVWVPKEIMMRYMGEGSGIKGIILSIILGSAAAGPLYGAFPVAAVFMKKGVRLSNILIFIGAWSTTKIPMFLFELSALGTKFALTRLLVDIPGIIIMAHILCRIVDQAEIEKIYENVKNMA